MHLDLNSFLWPRSLFVGVCLFLTIVVATAGRYGDTPSGSLNRLFELTQTDSDWEAMSEHIDWTAVLQSMPAKQRERYGLSTEADTRKFYLAFFKDPAHAVCVRYQTEDLMASSDDQEAVARLKAALARMNEEPLKKISQMRQVLREALFEVGTESIQGVRATVDIVVYSRDAMHDVQVVLTRTDGQWRLVMPQLGGVIDNVLGYVDLAYPDVYREIEMLQRARVDREKEAIRAQEEARKSAQKAAMAKAEENGLKAELLFVVVDENGQPIPRARVTWLLGIKQRMDDRPDGQTDEKGEFKATSSRLSSSLLIWKVSRDGYADEFKDFRFESIGEDYWLPRDKSIRVVLKKLDQHP